MKAKNEMEHSKHEGNAVSRAAITLSVMLSDFMQENLCGINN